MIIDCFQNQNLKNSQMSCLVTAVLEITECFLSQCLRLDSGYSIGFPVVVDGSTDSCIPTDLVEAKEMI